MNKNCDNPEVNRQLRIFGFFFNNQLHGKKIIWDFAMYYRNSCHDGRGIVPILL